MDLPIACTLSDSERNRRQETTADVLGQARRVEELANGYSFGFPGSAEWGNRLLNLINAERACCRFLAFELLFEPDLGSIWLKIRGPEGAKAFVEEDLAGFTPGEE